MNGKLKIIQQQQQQQQRSAPCSSWKAQKPPTICKHGAGSFLAVFTDKIQYQWPQAHNHVIQVNITPHKHTHAHTTPTRCKVKEANRPVFMWESFSLKKKHFAVIYSWLWASDEFRTVLSTKQTWVFDLVGSLCSLFNLLCVCPSGLFANSACADRFLQDLRPAKRKPDQRVLLTPDDDQE